jgi:pimeloyl-ACP methyl ester carboxylesterase
MGRRSSTYLQRFQIKPLAPSCTRQVLGMGWRQPRDAEMHKRRNFLLGPVSATFPKVGAAKDRTAWRTGQLAVPGGNVVWRTYGDGSGLPLIMVHGGPTPLGAKLFEINYSLGDERRLITWDQLDTGLSDKPRNSANWRIARFADELELVRQKHAPGPVHVRGTSLGAVIVMEWMTTREPKNVVSLVLDCPALDRERVRVAQHAAQDRLSAPSAAAFREFSRTGQITPAVAAAMDEYTREVILRRPPPGSPAYAPPDSEMARGLGPDLGARDRASLLRNLTQPVLFVRGEHDWVRDEDVRAYAALCRDAEVVTIADAGHLMFADNPRAYQAAVRQFLRRVDKTWRAREVSAEG